MTYHTMALDILSLTKKAGEIILGYYDATEDIAFDSKSDNTPLTQADLAANAFIVESLRALTPEIPIVSEELPMEENLLASQSDVFWLVDPLDGTKGFIQKNGQFTVNIAMVKDKHVIGGAVYVPAHGLSYYTGEDKQAYKQEKDETPTLIQVVQPGDDGVIVLASKHYRDQQTDDFINALPKVKALKSASSSLKFCVVAEGEAHLYPRFGPTSEWDTAAGQAVLEAAGGKVCHPDGSPYLYCKVGLKNTPFIASAA